MLPQSHYIPILLQYCDLAHYSLPSGYCVGPSMKRLEAQIPATVVELLLDFGSCTSSTAHPTHSSLSGELQVLLFYPSVIPSYLTNPQTTRNEAPLAIRHIPSATHSQFHLLLETGYSK